MKLFFVSAFWAMLVLAVAADLRHNAHGIIWSFTAGFYAGWSGINRYGNHGDYEFHTWMMGHDAGDWCSFFARWGSVAALVCATLCSVAASYWWAWTK